MSHAKRAIVTGAGHRLGRAMALYLADRGLDVVVHYNSSGDAAEEVAGLIRDKGRKAATVGADLLDEAAVQRVVPEVLRLWRTDHASRQQRLDLRI